jgi:hypothetical protein
MKIINEEYGNTDNIQYKLQTENRETEESRTKQQ